MKQSCMRKFSFWTKFARSRFRGKSSSFFFFMFGNLTNDFVRSIILYFARLLIRLPNPDSLVFLFFLTYTSCQICSVCLQCDQTGRYSKVLDEIFCFKSSPNVLLGYFEKHPLSDKNRFGNILVNFWNNLGYF